MQTKEIIEDIVMRELKGLCNTCIHAGICTYHKTTVRTIIQCELFEKDQEEYVSSGSLRGLCTTCDNASCCTLPERKRGVWRCNAFR